MFDPEQEHQGAQRRGPVSRMAESVAPTTSGAAVGGTKTNTGAIVRLIPAAAALGWVVAGLAAEDDGAAPVEWRADGESVMSIEDGARHLRMSENVVITQGGLEIRGDTALLEFSVETNDLRRVTVDGAPAGYRQLPQGGGEGETNSGGGAVTGSGDRILLSSDDDGNTVIEFSGNAEIQSRDLSTRCETIRYVAELELISASGNCAGAFAPRSD